jgi:hypothetical protein
MENYQTTLPEFYQSTTTIINVCCFFSNEFHICCSSCNCPYLKAKNVKLRKIKEATHYNHKKWKNSKEEGVQVQPIGPDGLKDLGRHTTLNYEQRMLPALGAMNKECSHLT